MRFAIWMHKRFFSGNFGNADCITHSMAQAACPLFMFLTLSISLLYPTTVNAEQQKAGERSGGEYTFGAGDILEISVFGEPEISKTVFIRIDGKISLPLIGDVQAADTNAAILAATISGKLVKFVADPNVTVILSASKSKVYYILGQIKMPGEYLITQPISVLQAIAKAGGLLEWAKKSKIMIVSRPGASKKITYFDYDDFLGGANIEQNATINPGDTIVIP
jgi:polysaccharide export outer membrane protein